MALECEKCGELAMVRFNVLGKMLCPKCEAAARRRLKQAIEPKRKDKDDA